MKKIIYLFLLIGVCLTFGKGLHFVRKGFSLRRFAAPLRLRLQVSNLEADRILEQPFYYVGRGRQCFAFESIDGKTILKLPRTDIYQVPFVERVIPILSKREANTRKAREQFVMHSMRMAFEDLQEETGVLALHLCQTKDEGKILTVIDPLGLKYQIPQHKTAFVLQKKHPILMQVFKEAENRDVARKSLDALIDLVIRRGQKGIGNKDGSFLKNYGFDGEKGYQIDIGSFYLNKDWKATVMDSLNPVRGWLKEKDPEMLAYLDIQLEKNLDLSNKESF